MRKTHLVLLLGAILLLIVGGLFLLIHRPSTQPVESDNLSEHQAKDSTVGLSVNYKDPLKEDRLTNQDKSDKFVLRLSSLDPAMLVSVRYEDGLRAVTSVTRQEPLDLILSNSSKSLPQRFNEYKKLDERELEIAGKPAAEIYLTYKGPSAELIKQRLLIVIKDDDTAIYISAQSQESQFQDLNTLYFDKIFSALSFSN